MVHSLAASKLQSNLEYKRQSKEERGHYKSLADQPGFLQAKKSQAQASNITYRNKLHDYTWDTEQLDVKHAKQAYKLQSDVSDGVCASVRVVSLKHVAFQISDCRCLSLQVNYKSDLNWIKGVGWTPPGSHKAELARRAHELGFAEGVTADEAIAKYQHMMMVREHGRMILFIFRRSGLAQGNSYS